MHYIISLSFDFLISKIEVITGRPGGAQSVKHSTSAQVTISQFMGSGPTSGSVLTAQSLEPASDSVSLPLCPSPTHASFSLSKIKIKKIIIKN